MLLRPNIIKVGIVCSMRQRFASWAFLKINNAMSKKPQGELFRPICAPLLSFPPCLPHSRSGDIFMGSVCFLTPAGEHERLNAKSAINISATRIFHHEWTLFRPQATIEEHQKRVLGQPWR
jgi:hypothetical protein